MTTTGTYSYNPAASSLMLTAFGRLGIRRTEITAQHLSDAMTESNLLQVQWSNLQPNLWSDELYQNTLVQGTATYTLPTRTVALQAVYLTTTSNGSSQDRILWPMSTFEYASQPNKTQQGAPTSYWFQRLETPLITLWPVPDGTSTYTLNTRLLHQIQDASLVGGANLDLPYRFLDAWVAGLASRLALIYKPEVAADMERRADKAWKIAAFEDQERVPIYITPSIGSFYYR